MNSGSGINFNNSRLALVPGQERAWQWLRGCVDAGRMVVPSSSKKMLLLIGGVEKFRVPEAIPSEHTHRPWEISNAFQSLQQNLKAHRSIRSLTSFHSLPLSCFQTQHSRLICQFILNALCHQSHEKILSLGSFLPKDRASDATLTGFDEHISISFVSCDSLLFKSLQ